MSLYPIKFFSTFCLGAKNSMFLVSSSLEESVEDVILVGRDDKSFNGETHLFSVVASEDIAEIACGHNELDAGGCVFGEGGEEREVRVEVVCYLGKDAGPVYGVDGAQVVILIEGFIREDLFYNVLWG